MIVAVVAILLLNATQIEEEKEEGKPSTFGQCLALLGKPFILLCFIGIMCHVGIDVGTNTTAPKILMERIGMGLDDAAFATSLYFIFRTAGCFLGSFILRKMSAKSFFAVSVIMMLAAMIGLFIFHEKAIIYVCIALIGFGNSNVFSVIFSQALLYLPGKKKRSFRPDDYGTFRRNGVPAGNGSGFGHFYGAEWCDCRNDCRCTLFAVLYVPYQKIILYLRIN